MKTKAKKFSRKLLAVFMAVLMALSCFAGAFSAFGYSNTKDYHDGNVEYNDLAWSVLSDEQVATAVLDWADEMLAQYGPTIDNLLKYNLPSSGLYYYNASGRYIGLNAAGIITAQIKVYVHSIDEVMETLESVASTLDSYGGFLGDAKNIQLGSTNGVRRSNTSSCDIIRDVLAILQKNSADYNGKDVIGEFLRGGFDLGTVGNLAGLDIYPLLGNMLGLEDGYQSNAAYNIVQHLLFNNTKWFTEEEIAAYKNGTKTFVYDEVLLDKLNTELLQKINVLVTYSDGTSSATRLADGTVQDPNLVYSDENEGNVLLFVYGDEKLEIKNGDSLFDISFDALRLAWKTVLHDTLQLVNVNYDVDRGHGSNFDNAYYKWAVAEDGGNITWDATNLASMYSQANINAWANAVYEAYSAESAEEFLTWVQEDFAYDREVGEDSTGAWDDIDPTTLLNKVRYSPLADYGFDMQTGPINLYFKQTGTANIDKFFEEDYSHYSSLVSGLNDALVAAVKDLFPESDNVIGTVPTLTTQVGDTTTDAGRIAIASTITNNAAKIVQYTADAVDANILKAFYDKNGASAALTEQNLEEAMVPLFISAIGQLSFGDRPLRDIIHKADWDRCKDAEAVAYLALREYLSYVLPENDYDGYATWTDTTITATLEGSIIPMARDALIYVIEPYVPVTDAQGNAWRAEDPNHSNADVFELLNSVACYYADFYTLSSPNAGERSMGVAPLLGVCDGSGNSTFNTNNTVWTNIDNAVNQILPILGELQYCNSAKHGQFNSYDLLWNDIVLGVLDIGDTSIHTSGLGGISNFLYRVVNIVSADPIQNTYFVYTAYDLVAEIINQLFGSRYTNQGWETIIPARSSSHPFDDLLQIGTIAGTSGTDIGVIQKLLCSLVEFTGYGTSGPSTYPDTMLPAVAFALTAVNSFMPNVVPQIGTHALKLATADFATPTIQQAKSGTAYDSSVVIKNNSIGVNDAYVNGSDNSVVQQSRYYIVATKVVFPNGVEKTPSSTPIAPGESLTVSNTTTFNPSGGANYSAYVATVTYNIVDKNGTVLYNGLECKAYQYVTSEQSWQEIVYPDGTKLDADLRNNSYAASKTKGGYKAFSTADAGKDLVFNYPQYIVLGTDNLDQISSFTYRVRNNSTGWFGNDRGYDGAFCYDIKSVSGFTYTKGINAVGNSNAIPVWDKATGDLLRIGLYDYSIDGGETWNRGTKDSTTGAYSGYSESEVANYINNHPNEDVTRRTHVPYTISEALSAGIIAAYNVTKAGVYDAVYLYGSTSGKAYDTILGLISCKGPVDGFYFNSTKVTVKKDSEQFISFMNYDGSTAVPAGEYPINMRFYSSSDDNVKYNTTDQQMTLVVGDTKNASAVAEKYAELSQTLANYRESDFTNQTVYNYAQQAMINALRAQASALTPETAVALSDQTYYAATTSTVDSELGDLAFKPFTEDNYEEYQMPLAVYADAYSDGNILYYDKDMTMPIYSNVPLESSDVADGFDPAYMAVAQDSEGVWHLVNNPSYAKTWDLTNGTPMRVTELDKETGEPVQATNDDGKLLYEQVQYQYRDANNNQVSSKDDWKAKFPIADYEMLEATPDEDTRGLYTAANEYLEYVLELVSTSINTSIAQDLFDNMTNVRHGMNEVNYEVVTFNKMVDYAKDVEKQYTINVTYEGYAVDEAGNYIDSEGNIVDDKADAARKNYTAEGLSVEDYYKIADNADNTVLTTTTSSTLSSVQVDEYLRMFNFYMGKVYERGYVGDQLEAEITHSGNAYDNMTAVAPVLDDDGTLVTAGSITKKAGAADPAYGAWDANGKLVNEGDVVYSQATWDTYVNALATAVDLATHGNTDYTHKTPDYYNAANADSYYAGVADVYEADTALQVAENRLTPSESVTLTVVANGADATVDGVAYTAPVGVEKGTTVTVAFTAPQGQNLEYIDVNGTQYTGVTSVDVVMDADTTVEAVFATAGNTVSGSIKIANDTTASAGTVSPYGVYTIDIYADADFETLVASVSSTGTGDNTFTTPALGAGTYYATVSSQYMLTLENVTIVVDGEDITDAVIYVVPCDYNGDGMVSVPDAKFVYAAAGTGANAEYCDLNGDTMVSVPDTKIVYKFAAGAILAPQTIA